MELILQITIATQRMDQFLDPIDGYLQTNRWIQDKPSYEMNPVNEIEDNKITNYSIYGSRLTVEILRLQFPLD